MTTYHSDLESIKKKINELCNDYQGKLSIDPFSLEKDCAEQSELYFEVVKGCSKIYCFVQRMKLQSKNFRSNIALAIRKDPEGYGYPKITESLITELVESDTKIIEIEEILNEANELSILVKGLLEAFEHRRSMLNNEVELFLSPIGGEVRNTQTKDYGEALEKGKTRSGFGKKEDSQKKDVPRHVRRHIPRE